MGNVIFKDFLLADNYHTGFQSHLTNFTSEGLTFQDSIVIGRTATNSESIDFHTKAKSSAIITPRTDEFLAKNI